MKASTVLSIFTFALAASAIPTRSGGNDNSNDNDGNQCSSNSKQVCCNGLLSILNCNLNILGSACSGDSYCCQSDAEGVLVVSALNCVSI